MTLPQLLPACHRRLLLCFTFSFDDYVVASFVAGTEEHLPIYVFASIGRGVTPEINAIGTAVMLLLTACSAPSSCCGAARNHRWRKAG